MPHSGPEAKTPSVGKSKGATGAPVAIPDHDLLRVIGRGSYGEVWLARSATGALRAVKIVRRDAFASDRPFEREFEGIQKFEPISRRHESQVDILHVGKAPGCFYYVMELADDAEGFHPSDSPPRTSSRGPESELATAPVRSDKLDSFDSGLASETYTPHTLKLALERHGPLPLDECVAIGLSLTTALEQLHKHGLVHRDIKPSNIIFIGGVAKLADIGLVTDIDATQSFVGTEGYIPPEGPGTPPADIFSLGKVLYEISTGKDRQDFPDPPTRWAASAEEKALLEFHEVLLRACERDLQRRYQTAREMRADLALLQSGKSVKRLRTIEKRLAWVSRAGVGAGILAVIALAAYVGSIRQARRADRNAEAEKRERQGAERANTQLTEALTRLELQKADDLLAGEETPRALAYLARLLRQQPTNLVAASRILSALSRRPVALRLIAPIQHPAAVHYGQFNPDGRWLLSWAKDGRERIWDARTGAVADTPLPKEFEANGIAFSNDGRKLLISSRHAVQLLDVDTGQPLFPPLRFEEPVKHARFSAEEDRVVTLTAAGATRVWDAHTGAALSPDIRLEPAPGDVHSWVLAPDTVKVGTVHSNGTARIWDGRTGRPLTPPLAYRFGSSMRQVVFSPNSKRAFVLTAPEVGQVVDANNGQPCGNAVRHRKGIWDASFSPDGQRLLTCSGDYSARLWDAATGEPLGEPMRHKNSVKTGRFSPDGLRVATGSFDNTARVWDASTGQPLSEPLQHGAEVRLAIFSLDGQRLATFSDDQMAQIWDVRPSEALGPVRRFQLTQQHYATSARFDPQGKKIISSAIEGNSALVWDAQSTVLAYPPLLHPATVRATAFTPSGAQLVTGSLDGHVRFWDWRTGGLARPPLDVGGQVWAIQFSPDGTRFVAATHNYTARVWNTESGQPATPPLRHDASDVNSPEFSPDGRRVLTAGLDSTARLWDAETGQQLLLLRHEKEVGRAVFSPDGEWIATASYDGTAGVWSARNGQLRFPKLRHNARVTVVCFSPGGESVLTTSVDGTARLWDARTGHALVEPLEHPRGVYTAEFSADGQRFVTGANDSGVRIWEVRTGERLGEVFWHGAPQGPRGIISTHFSPDGQWLVSAAMDTHVQLWEATPAPATIPDWLADLAEAVAEQRFVDGSGTEPVAWTKLALLRRRFATAHDSDFYTRWAKWFFAERSLRTISPNSAVKVPEYVQRLTDENTLESLRDAVRLDPTNGVVFARLAWQLLKQEAVLNPRAPGEADWLSRHALALAPADAEVLSTRSNVLKLISESTRP